jgi:hypothetical protein
MSVIEELDVKLFPAAFESDEEEPGAALESRWRKTGDHSFETGHTNWPCTRSERDSAHCRKSNADAGETAGSDCRPDDVKRARGQSRPAHHGIHHWEQPLGLAARNHTPLGSEHSLTCRNHRRAARACRVERQDNRLP